MTEVVRNALVDGEDPTQLVSIIPTDDDPSKKGIIAVNPDGSKIGGIYGANGRYFFDLAALQTAFPTSTIGDFANVNGDIYSWNGTAWTNTNIKYQGIMDVAGEKVNPATSEDMRKLMKAVQTLSIKGSGGQLRTVVDNVVGGTVIVTQATATNLNVTAALANNQVLLGLTEIGGISGKQLQFTNSRTAYATNTRSHLSYT